MPHHRLHGIVSVLFLPALLLFLPGCGGTTPPGGDSTGGLHALAIRYAGGFLLDTAAGIVRAEVVNPWQGKKKRRLTYLITSGTTHKEKRPGGAVTVRRPVRRVIVTSTTHIAFLKALGRMNNIVGISGGDYVCDTALQRRIDAGMVHDIGYDRNMNYEQIVKLHPDVVFLYGIGPEVTGTVARLAGLGIPAVVVGDYLERTPLGRAEWIRFFGAFFGMTEQPARWTDSVAARYAAIQAQGKEAPQPPAVMTGLPWNEVWYVPGGGSLTAAFIRDAGGRYVWEEIRSGDAVPMDIEKVYRKAGKADVWINCGTAGSLTAITATDKRLGLFRPVQERTVYNNDKRVNGTGGNDYWESGVIHPDIILEDLLQIFHPEAAEKDRRLVYYRKLE